MAMDKQIYQSIAIKIVEIEAINYKKYFACKCLKVPENPNTALQWIITPNPSMLISATVSYSATNKYLLQKKTTLLTS